MTSSNEPIARFGTSAAKGGAMMSAEIESRSSTVTRRQFCRKLAGYSAVGALLGSLPKGWAGSTPVSDAPEVSKLKFGMIALTDCSPIVIAHEKGLFKKYGIEATVSKGANWAAIRD